MRMLLNDEPYTVTKNGGEKSRGVKVVICVRAGIKAGERLYQMENEDGSILMIPEKLYKKSYKK